MSETAFSVPIKPWNNEVFLFPAIYCVIIITHLKFLSTEKKKPKYLVQTVTTDGLVINCFLIFNKIVIRGRQINRFFFMSFQRRLSVREKGLKVNFIIKSHSIRKQNWTLTRLIINKLCWYTALELHFHYKWTEITAITGEINK